MNSNNVQLPVAVACEIAENVVDLVLADRLSSSSFEIISVKNDENNQ